MTYYDDLFLEDLKDTPSFEKRIKKHDYRYDFVLDIMKQTFIKDEKVSLLDFGCGDGLMLELAKNTSIRMQLRGVDISRLAREACRKNTGIVALDNLDKCEEADVVVAMQVLEHLKSPEDYLKRLYNKTKRFLIIMVPIEHTIPDRDHQGIFNYYSVFGLCSFLRPKDFHIYMLNKWNKRGNPLNLFAAVIFK